MALTGAEKSTLADITQESLATVTSKADGLDSDVEDDIQEDIVLWNTLKDKHLRVSGGRDGVDLDSERSRKAIRMRNRLRLGLPALSEVEGLSDPNAIYGFTLNGGSWF